MDSEWTAESDAHLRALWTTRLSDKEIAARLNHSMTAVRRRAYALGLGLRRVIWRRLEAAADASS